MIKQQYTHSTKQQRTASATAAESNGNGNDSGEQGMNVDGTSEGTTAVSKAITQMAPMRATMSRQSSIES